FGKSGFGLQESADLRRPPRLHTDSVLGAQVLDGKLIKSTFIWIRTHVHILPEAAAIDKSLTEGFSVQVLRHLILAHGPCITLGPLGTRPRVGARPQHPSGHPPPLIYSLAAATNSLGFVLQVSFSYFSTRA
ncbi:unnamed protein product, partial [Urochloa humidicola]